MVIYTAYIKNSKHNQRRTIHKGIKNSILIKYISTHIDIYFMRKRSLLQANKFIKKEDFSKLYLFNIIYDLSNWNVLTDLGNLLRIFNLAIFYMQIREMFFVMI